MPLTSRGRQRKPKTGKRFRENDFFSRKNENENAKLKMYAKTENDENAI